MGPAPPVLIVDDDADTRAMVSVSLTHHGYTAVTAENGKDGLAKTRQHRPCLILLDLMMPDMDGAEFRRLQVTDPAIAAIPVVLISAHAVSDQVAEELGVRGLRKPFSIAELLKVVERTCRPDATSAPS
jgi:CheY-like chemotaxis protein